MGTRKGIPMAGPWSGGVPWWAKSRKGWHCPAPEWWANQERRCKSTSSPTHRVSAGKPSTQECCKTRIWDMRWFQKDSAKVIPRPVSRWPHMRPKMSKPVVWGHPHYMISCLSKKRGIKQNIQPITSHNFFWTEISCISICSSSPVAGGNSNISQIFIPGIGEDRFPILTRIFFNLGWLKPPTRWGL